MGARLKKYISLFYHLDMEENRTSWCNPPGQGGLEAWERRVLMAKWTCAAWLIVSTQTDFLRVDWIPSRQGRTREWKDQGAWCARLELHLTVSKFIVMMSPAPSGEGPLPVQAIRDNFPTSPTHHRKFRRRVVGELYSYLLTSLPGSGGISFGAGNFLFRAGFTNSKKIGSLHIRDPLTLIS